MNKNTPWLMLFSRVIIFLLMQSAFALVMFLSGSGRAWEDGANWWMLSVAAADALCLVLLIRVYRAEGLRYFDVFHIDRQYIPADLLALLGMTIIVAPVSYFPNVWLGALLFGKPEATLDLIVRPLPFWAVIASIVLFPLGQSLTELATYFIYIKPRLETQGLHKWAAITITALMLAFQHIAAPLLFDGRFILWRALMFVPFAFVTALAFHWRPRMLPYFVVVHFLMNASFAAMFLRLAF